MTDAPKFTNFDKAREAEREVAMRYRVYGSQSGGGPMPAVRRKQIEIMEEIASEYRALADKEKLL